MRKTKAEVPKKRQQWTERDEAKLRNMQRRRDAANEERLKALEEIIDDFYYRDMEQTALAQELSLRADALARALAPFCREVEVHKTRRKPPPVREA